ncbi:MAG: GHMP kinase [Anaerolineales bacterium]|nr:GHMP kinase [Anaerolineales bacterium]
MIVIQTPLRISFFGGGTDFPGYFLENGGCVLSSAIDKYIFVTIKKRFDKKLRVGYTRTEMVDDVSEIDHELIRESMKITGIRDGVEITTMGDIPSEGSGLGSSSTVTVGALHSMHTLHGEMVSSECLARQACEVEIDRLGKPIGIQDQYIAAFGGLRFREFGTNGEVHTEKIELSSDNRRRLEENLLLFYTGTTRRADTILTEQKHNIQDRKAVLNQMKQIAYDARAQLLAGKVDAIGELLDVSWQLKKQLASNISNSTIDEAYENAKAAGAIGGKVTGAGGGGFLLFYCHPVHQDKLRAALHGLSELPFRLEANGSKVIFNYSR